jgi:hypothetical protein
MFLFHSEMLSLNLIVFGVPFFKLATKFSTPNHTKYRCLTTLLALDGHHQGDIIAHKILKHACP